MFLTLSQRKFHTNLMLNAKIKQHISGEFEERIMFLKLFDI